MMAYFTLGTNMPGYLPESAPYVVETADEAKRAMIDELLRDADIADEQAGYLEEGKTQPCLDEAAAEHARAEALSAEAEDLNLSDVSAGWGAIIGNTAYWIEPQTGEMPDDYWGLDYPNDDAQTEETDA